MIDQNEIRKEVALQNGVWLGANDPMLQTVTIFEKALEQSVSTLNAQHEANVKALTKVIQQGSVEAKATAGKIILDAAGYVSDQAHNAIKATIDEGREELRADLRLAWNKIEDAKKVTAIWAAASALCAAISVAAMFSVF